MKNRTKKMLALILALVFVVALFAGCGGNNSGNNGGSSASGSGSASTGSSTPSGSADTGSTGGSADTGADVGSGDDTGAAPADEGPYCYAAGKFEWNDRGFPATKYEYTQPISTTDEVLTEWTTCYTPQYIPDDDWGSIPTWQELEERTGVHIEYNIIASSTRSQNFSVLLAADDLDDIMDQGSYYYTSGTLKEACEGATSPTCMRIRITSPTTCISSASTASTTWTTTPRPSMTTRPSPPSTAWFTIPARLRAICSVRTGWIRWPFPA